MSTATDNTAQPSLGHAARMLQMYSEGVEPCRATATEDAPLAESDERWLMSAAAAARPAITTARAAHLQVRFDRAAITDEIERELKAIAMRDEEVEPSAQAQARATLILKEFLQSTRTETPRDTPYPNAFATDELRQWLLQRTVSSVPLDAIEHCAVQGLLDLTDQLELQQRNQVLLIDEFVRSTHATTIINYELRQWLRQRAASLTAPLDDAQHYTVQVLLGHIDEMESQHCDQATEPGTVDDAARGLDALPSY